MIFSGFGEFLGHPNSRKGEAVTEPILMTRFVILRYNQQWPLDLLAGNSFDQNSAVFPVQRKRRSMSGTLCIYSSNLILFVP